MTSKVMTNPTWVRAYTLAGNATLTITSKRTQARYTYKVTQAKRDNGERQEGRYFVSLLTGPNNEGDYTYLGMLHNNVFVATKATRGRETSAPYLAFAWFWTHLSLHNNLRVEQMEVRHEGSCGRCGRKLTVPASIDNGIGPECANHMGIVTLTGTAESSPRTRKRRYNPSKPRPTQGELAQARRTNDAVYTRANRDEVRAETPEQVKARYKDEGLDDSDWLNRWNN